MNVRAYASQSEIGIPVRRRPVATRRQTIPMGQWIAKSRNASKKSSGAAAHEICWLGPLTPALAFRIRHTSMDRRCAVAASSGYR